MRAGARGIGLFRSGTDDDGNLINPGADRFLNENGQRGFCLTVPIHQSLERQGSLVFASGCDDGLENFHAPIMRPEIGFGNT
jgi:hypothetical protein